VKSKLLMLNFMPIQKIQINAFLFTSTEYKKKESFRFITIIIGKQFLGELSLNIQVCFCLLYFERVIYCTYMFDFN